MTEDDQIHITHWLPLNDLYYGRDLMKTLRKVVEEILNNPERICPNCGGMRPEIVFQYNGYNYFFTCWKIKKKNKKIAETDYEKMVEYFHEE